MKDLDCNASKTTQLPKSFKEIQENCDERRLALSVLQQTDLSELSQTQIAEPMNLKLTFDRCHIIQANIISNKKVIDSSCFMIGEYRDRYYNTSAIYQIDFDSKLLRTESGNTYRYKELFFTDPDNYCMGLCATFTHWGWQEGTKTPDVFFN